MDQRIYGQGQSSRLADCLRWWVQGSEVGNVLDKIHLWLENQQVVWPKNSFCPGCQWGDWDKDVGVCLSRASLAFSEYSVFHQEISFRDYFSMFTCFLSNAANFPSSLRPVVESSYISRVLLLEIKFFLRNIGGVAVPRMQALFSSVL